MLDYRSIKDIAKQTGYSTHDLLALSSTNDPFYAGSETTVELAHWFKDLWKRLGYAGRGGVHLRRVHYRLLGNAKVDGLPYENTRNDWNHLLNASRYARYLGLVDPEDLIDRRNPEPHIYLVRPEDDAEPGYEVEERFYELELPTVDPDLVWDLDYRLAPPEITSAGHQVYSGLRRH